MRALILIVLTFLRVSSIASADVAKYGVQHTNRSGKPLWHAERYIAMTIDTSTVPAADIPAIIAGFKAWETATEGCGGVSFSFVQAKARNGTPNTIRIRTDSWPNEAAAAATHLYFTDDPDAPDDGLIYDAEVELNAVDFELLAAGSAPHTSKPALDLQAVVTHEAGHVLGLAHDCTRPGEPATSDEQDNAVPACDLQPLPAFVRASTMYYTIAPGELGARTPEDNDAAGACALLARVPVEAVIGGCSMADGAGGGPVVIVCVWLCCARRRRDRS